MDYFIEGDAKCCRSDRKHDSNYGCECDGKEQTAYVEQ